MTILAFLDQVRIVLEKLYGNSEANAIGNHLIQERLSLSFSDIKAKGDEPIPEKMAIQLMDDLSRLKTLEPVQYVLGYTWFNEMKIAVNNNVLIPRPETEELIDFIQDHKFGADAVFLDIGTGSGCIALALKQAYPNALVYGSDISQGALEIASLNGEALNLPVLWLRWDVLTQEAPQIELPHFDLIVSNPPYICMGEYASLHSNVTDYEPHIALFVPDDDPLLFYRYIANYACKMLKSGGSLWFEINREYAEQIADLLEVLMFRDIRIYRDLSGNDRFVSAMKN